MSLLELQSVSFAYTSKKQILSNVDLSFDKQKIYAITGKSGTGKTTLLSLLSLLTKPNSGTILFNGSNTKDMNPYTYRNKYVGVIFQSFNLLPQLNAIENIVLSMDIANIKGTNKKKEAIALLTRVGISEDDMYRTILTLSGGQQQRVAIARALSYNPDVILADEPTGNLDHETEDDILNIFKQLAYEEGKSIIIVTHSNKVARNADIIYRL